MDQFLIKKDASGKFERTSNPEDMRYRKIQKATFAEKLEKILPKETPLCFHGTPIWNAKEIISSGNISAEIDRKGAGEEVLDMPGKISVSTIENLWFTVKQFADLANFKYPAGCIFVITPKDEKEFLSAKTHKIINNVDFAKEPERLQNIITTPENIEKVKGWLAESGLEIDENIVVDYEGYLKNTQKEFDKTDEKTL